MNPLLVAAIEHRQRLCFTYNGRTRIVEPQCYGVGTRITELMRVHVHPLQGGRVREPLFDVAKISGLEVSTRPSIARDRTTRATTRR